MTRSDEARRKVGNLCHEQRQPRYVEGRVGGTKGQRYGDENGEEDGSVGGIKK